MQNKDHLSAHHRYHEQDPTMVIKLSNEIDMYHEDNDLVSPSSILGLDETIFATNHTWNTKDLKSRMIDSSLFTIRKR